MANPIGIQVLNLKQTQFALIALGARGQDALAGAMVRKAEEIIGDSKENYVPVRDGILRNSGFVDQPKKQGPLGVTVELGFGGPTAPYALVQHEGDFSHTVGQKKYLEIPFNLALRTLDKDLAKDIRKNERRFR